MRALIFYLAEETTRQTDSRSIPCDGRFSSNIPECKSAICNLILQALCRVIYQFFDAVDARNLLGRNIDSLRLQWVPALRRCDANRSILSFCIISAVATHSALQCF